jgi:hypothetical protein
MMGWKKNDLTIAAGGPLATFAPGTYVFSDTQHVVHQGFSPQGGSDGHVHELYWSGGTWAHHDLTDAAGAPPISFNSPTGYAFESENTQHVNYTDSAGHVHELYWNSDDGWNHHDLTNATGAPLALSGPVGFAYDFGQHTQHVFYTGVDAHVHELWWRSGGAWQHRDLTAITGAPNGVTGDTPTAYVCGFQETKHLDIVGSDGHIHEFWWDNGGWHHNDLTADAGAPLAGGPPSGYSFDFEGTQHVDYPGTDGHIHELWWATGTWHHTDLTSVTGGAYDYSGEPLTGYVFNVEESQHVDYLGSDGHIHELWWLDQAWHYRDVTAATVAPAAISSPHAYAFSAIGTQQIVYNSEQHHIVQLYWIP